MRILSGLGISVDRFVSNQLRSYRDNALLEQIRHRPCEAQLLLMLRRVRNADANQFSRYAGHMRHLTNELPACLEPLGTDHRIHTFWMLPIRADDPDTLVELLRRNHFDATSTHRLSEIHQSETHAAATESINGSLLNNVVFLPTYPEMPQYERARMQKVLAEYGATQAISSRGPQHQGTAK